MEKVRKHHVWVSRNQIRDASCIAIRTETLRPVDDGLSYSLDLEDGRRLQVIPIYSIKMKIDPSTFARQLLTFPLAPRASTIRGIECKGDAADDVDAHPSWRKGRRPFS